jgi:hypothetical protein
MPDATAEDEPPLLPPGVNAGFHGFPVTPQSLLWVASAIHAEFGRIGLADDHGSGGAQTGYV